MRAPRAQQIAVLLVMATASLAVAACGGGATPTPAAATPPATASPAAVASASPTPAPTAKPSPTPSVFISKAYGYSLEEQPTWLADQAKQPWDGTARIDSNGPYVDSMILPGSVLFFVYGAPTDLGLDAYAAKTQEQMVAWHACPAVPEAATDLALDGTPGRLHQMTCQGLFVQKLMAVRDGQGISVNMLAPPGSRSEAEQLFRKLVATMRWPA